MSFLSKLKTDNTIKNETNRVGGGGVLETGIYNMVIDTIYVDASKGGAINVNYVFKGKNGEQMRSTQYVTSGEAKGCLNYYVDRNGDKQYLPGFNVANSIALLTVGEEIGELETTPKTLKIYDFDAKKELPKEKEVFMDMVGQEITIAVQKVIEDKNVKNGAGEYVPSGETRTINEIDKVFRSSDMMTTAEIREEATEAVFHEKWLAANDGKIRDKTAAKRGAQTGATTAASGAAAAPSKKLFG